MGHINKKQVSKCCSAPVVVEGITTHYYGCTKCGKACDVVDKGTNTTGDGQ